MPDIRVQVFTERDQHLRPFLVGRYQADDVEDLLEYEGLLPGPSTPHADQTWSLLAGPADDTDRGSRG